jgi:hypothetical protein
VLRKIVGRILKLLTRRGALVQDRDSVYVADAGGDCDEVRTLRPLQAAACTYRIAFGPRAVECSANMAGCLSLLRRSA